MPLNTTDKVRLGFAITMVLLLTAVGLSYRTTFRLIDTNHLVARSNSAFANLEGTTAALDNLERSRIAWINAGRAMHNLRVQRFRDLKCNICHGAETQAVEAERFRDIHREMIRDLTRHVQSLRSVIASDPAQSSALQGIEALVQGKNVWAKEEIEPRHVGRLVGPTSPSLHDQAQLTDRIRKIVANMERAESELLARRLREREATARSEILALGLLGFLAICVAVSAYIVIRRDLARREALQEQLRQTTKMDAVGRLAGGVAHNFNNLLTPILGYAELLEIDLGESHPVIEHVNQIKTAAATAASVTRQLLAFGRRQVLQPRRLNLNTVTVNMGGLLQRLIGEKHELKTLLEPALGWVEADPAQVEQVIRNLVLNARDNTPNGGIIALETANAELKGEKTCWSGVPLRGAYVVLAVSDTGTGMDERTRSRIFEPFFTTKETGRGTGLGLATVYGIVAQSNGRICVQTAVGCSTRFEIYLPRVDPRSEDVRSRRSETEVTGNDRTILLVDDDEAVRRISRHALVEAGYDVLEAHDGVAALLTAQASRIRIDLLVSDVMMPGLNGLELHDQLLGLLPRLKTIFISGHAADSERVGSILDEDSVFLAKPFTPSQLVERAASLLHA